MSRLLHAPTASVDIDEVVDVSKGGLGIKGLHEVSQKLDLVTTNMVGIDIARLDANRKLIGASSISALIGYPTIKGPKQVARSITVQYIITNYDSIENYDISVSGGMFRRNKEIITYTAPNVEGEVSLTINGRTILIGIVRSAPNQPSITSPLNGSSNLNSSFTITSSSYSHPDITKSHQNTSWEVSETSSFISTVFSSNNNAVNKTSIMVTGLQRSKTYYVRARYKDSSGENSDWSLVTSFSTKDIFFASTEVAYINDPQRDTGFGLQFNQSGTKVFSVAPFSTVSPGDTYGFLAVYSQINSTWGRTDQVYRGDAATYDGFDYFSFDVSEDENHLVGNHLNRYHPTHNPQTSNNIGAVTYYYKETNGFYYRGLEFFGPNPNSNQFFGKIVAINSNGTYLFVGNGGVENGNIAYLYKRTGTIATNNLQINIIQNLSSVVINNNVLFPTDAQFSADSSLLVVTYADRLIRIYSLVNDVLTQIHEINPPAVVVGGSQATCTKISSDASRIFVSSIDTHVDGVQYAGVVYVYTRSANTWNLEATLSAPDKVTNLRLGWGIATSADGSKLYASAAEANVDGFANCGKIYSFIRNGTSWSYVSTLLPSNKLANTNLGRSRYEGGGYGFGKYNLTTNADGTMLAASVYQIREGSIPRAGFLIFA